LSQSLRFRDGEGKAGAGLGNLVDGRGSCLGPGEEVFEMAEEMTVAPEQSQEQSSTEISEELLVEEISIDGMCGVY
jgi:mycofactocin precursor